MQLKLLYPRRSRFAPIAKLSFGESKVGYVKEQFYKNKLSNFSCFVKNKRKLIVEKHTILKHHIFFFCHFVISDLLISESF